jgi:mannose-6-phosphate isomerase-like protein (cupin superfamily)
MARTTAKAKPRVKANARAASRKPPARRAKTAKPAKTSPRPAPAPMRPPQRFTVSHHNESDFQVGLRRYAQYRDLGISPATGGMVQAHVIRFVPPCRPEEVSKLHLHDVEFQMVYVLKGWMRSEFEGQGAHTMKAGSCWIQPPRIQHKVLDYSDDCEVLEIILPAEFDTLELE